MATIVLSITAPSLTVILSLTYRTSPPLFMVPQSSARLTLCVHITRSLWSLTTFQKLLSSLPLGYLNSYGCHLASGMQVSHFNVSWYLRLVLERLATHGLSIDPTKCIFGVPSLDFLGHHVSSDGIQPLENNVQAIRNFPQPAKTSPIHWSGEFLPPVPARLRSHHATPQPTALTSQGQVHNPYMDRRGCVSIQQDQGCSC